MRFKYALQVLLANFRQVYKLLLYKLICLVIIFGACFAGLRIGYGDILKKAGITDVIRNAYLLVKNLFVSVDINVETFRTSVKIMSDYIANHSGSLTCIIVILSVTLLVYRFFSGMGNYAVGKAVNDHMSSLTHRGFLIYLTEGMGRNALSQLFSATVITAVNILEIALTFLIVHFLSPTLGFFAIFIAVSLFFAIDAVARGFISDLAPAVITSGSVKKGLQTIFRRPFKDFLTIASLYVVVEILAFYFTVTVCLFTLGVGLLILIPILSLFFVSVQFVHYYTVEKKKFYLSYDNVVVPKELRDEEKLLNKMDI